MSDNVKVVVKVRPLIGRELEEKLSSQWRVKSNTLYQIDQDGKDCGTSFTFDRVYDVDTNTSNVYNEIARPIVEAATAGINGTIFAYGQTSSGKTFTMTGTKEYPGIIPLAVHDLFDKIKNIPNRDFLLRVTYIEIYNEKIRDLLNENTETVKIFESHSGVRIDAVEKVTSSPDELLNIMKQGEFNRHIGATNMNEKSSRSHTIFQITIESQEHAEGEEAVGSVNVSQLNLVDLAGSERSGQTGATGIRFREGCKINQSLSTLGLVIKQLSEDPNKFANFRDSKLTRILQNSLGGNAKTSIICAVSPAALEETISTLNFANRAKAIKNKPEVNAVATNATMLQSLTKKLANLQYELENKKFLEQDNHMLTMKIKELQRQILNGFGQSRDAVAVNRRKTWCAPRRATISALHPIEEENSLKSSVPIRKFATPILKYNPLLYPDPSIECVTSKRPEDILEVSEEMPHVAMTPLRKRNVKFNDEVIELDDSDDDASGLEASAGGQKPCSPYHRCYSSAKTPPCILRVKAKKAEQSLEDHLHWTEREKIYSPDVVELLEKLENNTEIITTLEEKIKSSEVINKTQDFEIKTLKEKIAESENKIKTAESEQVQMELMVTDLKRKLTDLEVCYERLKFKAGQREEELLSLIEDKKCKVRAVAGPDKTSETFLKSGLAAFLNYSNDISLVNSDAEVSTNDDQIVDEPQEHVQRLVSKWEKQLNEKSNTILDIEQKLHNCEQKLLVLQNKSTDKDKEVEDLNKYLTESNRENLALKTLITDLNLTIDKLKSCLSVAENHIKNYSDTEKIMSELPCNEIDKSGILGEILTQETKVLNNNEQLRNITETLKEKLEIKKIEIEDLKSSISNFKSIAEGGNGQTLCKCDIKDIQIKSLEDEITNIGLVQDEYTAKINLMEQEMKILNDANMEYFNKVAELSDENDRIKVNLSEMTALLTEKDSEICNLMNRQGEMQLSNDYLLQLHERIDHLEDNIKCKVTEISSLTVENDILRKEHAMIADEINTISLAIMQKFTDDINNYSHSDIKICIHQLKSNVKFLENKLNAISVENDFLSKSNIDLKVERDTIAEKYSSSIESSKQQIEMLTVKDKESDQKLILITDQFNQLYPKIEELKVNLDMQETEKINLVAKLSLTSEANEKAQTEIILLKSEINELFKKDDNSNKELQKLKISLENTTAEFDHVKSDSDRKLAEVNSLYTTCCEELDRVKVLLISKEIETGNLEKKIQNIMQKSCEEQDKISELTQRLQQTQQELYEKELLCSFVIGNFKTFLEWSHLDNKETTRPFEINSYEKDHLVDHEIASYLKKVADIFMTLRSKLYDIENGHKAVAGQLNSVLTDAQTEMSHLRENKTKLEKELLSAQHSYTQLLVDFETLKDNNRDLNNNLLESKQYVNELNHTVLSQKSELEILRENIRKVESEQTQRLILDTQKLKDIEQHCIKLQSKLLECNQFKMELEQISVEKQKLAQVNTDLRQQITNFNEFKVSLHTSSESHSPLSLTHITYKKILELLGDSYGNCSKMDDSIINKAKEDDYLQVDLNILNTLQKEVLLVRQENASLKNKVRNLEHDNKQISHEVELLLKPAGELFKRISNHRTNLSTLTATTHAENKMLRTKVKALQHHHERFHTVCQRDIPEMRKQLYNLLEVLQNNLNPIQSPSKICNSTFIKKNCKKTLDTADSPGLSNSKNELSITLESDILMLENNFTLSQSIYNTLALGDQSGFDVTLCHREVECQTDELYTAKVVKNNQELVFENSMYTDALKSLESENSFLKTLLKDYRTCVNKDMHINLEEEHNMELSKIEQQGHVNLTSCQLAVECQTDDHNQMMVENIKCSETKKSLKTENRPLQTVPEAPLCHQEVECQTDESYIGRDAYLAICDQNQQMLFDKSKCLDTLKSVETENICLQTISKDHKTCVSEDVHNDLEKELNRIKIELSQIELQSNVDLTSWGQEVECQTDELYVERGAYLELENQNQKMVLEISTFSDNIKGLEIENISLKTLLKDHKKCVSEDFYNNLQNELNMKTTEISNIKLQMNQFSFEKLELVDKTNKYIADNLDLNNRLQSLVSECHRKEIEVEKFNNLLITLRENIKHVQEENEALSTQVMDGILEVDSLREEIESLTSENKRIIARTSDLNKTDIVCAECLNKDIIIKALESSSKNSCFLKEQPGLINNNFDCSTVLDNSLRCDKIFNLKNELEASQEDCKKITEEVATIRSHVERSNLSLKQPNEFHQSIHDPDLFTDRRSDEKAEDRSPNKSMKLSISHHEKVLDLYELDKCECLNYCIDKIGNVSQDLDSASCRMIDIIKIFYATLCNQHSNTVQNLHNNIRDLEDERSKFQSNIKQVSDRLNLVSAEFETKYSEQQSLLETTLLLKNNLESMQNQFTDLINLDDEVVFQSLELFNTNILEPIDKAFSVSISDMFKELVQNMFNSHQQLVNRSDEICSKLKSTTEELQFQINTLSEQLEQMKDQLSNKVNDYNLLKAQKEKSYEINQAVTLDIVKRERKLKDISTQFCDRLKELKIISLNDVDLTLAEHEIIEKNINTLLHKYEENINTHETILQKNNLEIKKIDILNSEVLELTQRLSASQDNTKVLEDQARKAVEDSSAKDDSLVQALDQLEQFKLECAQLKSLNSLITAENTTLSDELQKCEILIKQKHSEYESLSAELIIAQTSLTKILSEMQHLKEGNDALQSELSDSKRDHQYLTSKSTELENALKTKCSEFSVLEKNIKTHQKTAEIQTSMIKRLQKDQENLKTTLSMKDSLLDEKRNAIDELTNKYDSLHQEYTEVSGSLKAMNSELFNLRDLNEALEVKVSSLQAKMDTLQKDRSPALVSSAMQKSRRSLLPSAKDKENVPIGEDHRKPEMIFGSRLKPDDLFMDIEQKSSESTPSKEFQKRSSWLTLKHDNLEDEVRNSSLNATRRRRQSTHDSHRSSELSQQLTGSQPGSREGTLVNDLLDLNKSSEESRRNVGRKTFQEIGLNTSENNLSDVTRLKAELDELKERYRDLDDECETCAAYLREREEQCYQLKAAKSALEKRVAEMTQSLEESNKNKLSMQNVAVNTDADWTNLHSVVVDRMSYDSQVEKNKTLTKAVEAIRVKNHELKENVKKLQRTTEEKKLTHSETLAREVEKLKEELTKYKQQYEDLSKRYQEVDEECEICASYLREREEQCFRLKESKTALEAKVAELQENAAVNALTHTVRKKRQSLHDQNRDSEVRLVDTSTNTSQDALTVLGIDVMTYEAEKEKARKLQVAVDELKSRNSELGNKLRRQQRSEENTVGLLQAQRPATAPSPNVQPDGQAAETQHLKKLIESLNQEKLSLEQQNLALEHRMQALLSTPVPSNAPPAILVATGSAIVQNQQICEIMKENHTLKKINAKLISLCQKRGKPLPVPSSVSENTC